MEIQSSQDQFNRQAALYAVSPVHRFGPSLPVLVEMAKPQADDVALDIATGTGHTAFTLAQYVREIFAVDLAVAMLAQGRVRARDQGLANIQFREGSAESLPFLDRQFSLVVSRHAPHHFHDAPKFLGEVRRVLTDSGRFVLADQISPAAEISEWIDHWERTRDPSHFFQRTVPQWQRLAQEAGFSWIKHEIVPYRLQFDWWTTQAGCNTETIGELRRHFEAADPEVIKSLEPELDENGQLLSFIEPMLVARMEPVAG